MTVSIGHASYPPFYQASRDRKDEARARMNMRTIVTCSENSAVSKNEWAIYMARAEARAGIKESFAYILSGRQKVLKNTRRSVTTPIIPTSTAVSR